MRDRHDDPSAQDPLPGLRGVGRSTPATGATHAKAVDGAAETSAATEVGAASSVGAASAAGGASEVGAVGAVAADPVASITDALATGAIDADTARSRLIDAVVASQMPPGADPAVWQAIRAEVEALVAGDPTIADLLRV
ncbi:MAG TPA: hypothetical protein VGB85_01445 [Nannocystis sp.]|jgi:hypothetical protein